MKKNPTKTKRAEGQGDAYDFLTKAYRPGRYSEMPTEIPNLTSAVRFPEDSPRTDRSGGSR